MEAAFLLAAILQLLAFGVRGVNQVSSVRTLTQPAHFLEQAQKLGLDPRYFHNADDDLFCGSVCVIAFMLFVFGIQEYFEFKTFVKPAEKTWSLLMDASGFLISIVSGPMFLPIFNTLLWPFQDSASSPYLHIYKPLGMIVAAVAAYYSFRFVRVDKKLLKINANGIGLILWSLDDEITVEERMVNRRHPLSPWNPMNDKMKLASKILLSMARILLTEDWPITAGVLRVLIGLGLFYVDLTMDAFYKPPVVQGIDWNAFNAAAGAGIAVTYLSSLFMVVMYQMHIDSNPEAALMKWEGVLVTMNLASLPVACFTYYYYRAISDYAKALKDSAKLVGYAREREEHRFDVGIQEPLLGGIEGRLT